MNKPELIKRNKELREQVKSLEAEINREDITDDEKLSLLHHTIESFLYVDGYEGGDTQKPYQRIFLRLVQIIEGEI
jgi:hypothetical protein